MTWKKAQQWESEWWGHCINTYGEETKQILYAQKMGLRFFHDGKSPYNIDMKGKRVLDIGGGPSSLLLKCINVEGTVSDPLLVPEWVKQRYECAGIDFLGTQGEDLRFTFFDECWIYNVLQHTRNPELVIGNAKKAATLIRIFEWVDTPTNEGHPHSLSESFLNAQLGGIGKVEYLKNQNTCTGKCYYGIFPTKGK